MYMYITEAGKNGVSCAGPGDNSAAFALQEFTASVPHHPVRSFRNKKALPDHRQSSDCIKTPRGMRSPGSA